MFSKYKKTFISLVAGLLLITNLSGVSVLADTTGNTNTATTNNVSADKTSSNNSADTAATDGATSNQPYVNIDTEAVRSAMLSELNRLRAQNGLSALTSVPVLNTYAQARTQAIANIGSVDNHTGWHSSNMYPYNYTAEENISQVPFFMIDSTDPVTIAQKITQEFYEEKYDSNPNYGHRKNMLNPYINYVGIGITISDNGMVYAAQEMGNDKEAYDKYDPNDVYAYYLTNKNDYANKSKYDLADADKTGADYADRPDYSTNDMRGGVTTKSSLTPLYDRYGNKRNDLELSPNSDWISDIIATINGKYYYHVSTNGFIAANDALPWASFLAGTKVTAITNAKIYDNNGVYTGRNVAINSKWIVDRRTTNPINNEKMYRIGTNAWLQENQISQK